LEHTFSNIWVQGEISNLRAPISGHLYFTLKDDHSQIRAVLFRRSAMLLRFALESGLQVVLCGKVTVYEPRGDCQILVDSIEPQGLGALQLAYEQLKEKLAKEGLFDSSRKQDLPFFPKVVGVITSQTGAAIRDILTVLHRRCPIIRVYVYPVAVQGQGAPAQIVEAIRRCDRQSDVDVMIVGRGGGSWEDLWSFNEEKVVRAIADARTPVVSAVGHEIDVTLADFVADYRAPTPSAAAELVSPVLEDLLRMIHDCRLRMLQSLQNQLSALRNQFRSTYRALPAPNSILQIRVQKVDDLEQRLTWAMKSIVREHRPVLLSLSAVVMRYSPDETIKRASLLVHQYVTQLNRAMPVALNTKRYQLRTVASSLQTLNPLAILSRGYSVLVEQPGGEIVRSHNQVQAGERIKALLADGSLTCLVERVDPLANS
jgi:exodeoxyribonuclease VII large subunit